MRKLSAYLLAALLLAACTPEQPAGENTFYVSIPPLRSIVEGIVGDDFKLEVLVPPGASPETFEPTPRQFVELNKAQLIFNVGLIDFETTLLGKVGDQAKVVNLSRGIDLIAGSCSHGHHGHDHGHAHGVDPHVWTSPKALQTMAANAYEAIRNAYPDSVKYEAGYNRLRSTLKELDIRTAEKIARSGVKYFIVYHPALTYYARDYGLRQVAIEADGKEPSAKQLTAVIRQAREDGVRRIFYQNQFPASTVEIIARDIDAEYVEIDPLDEDAIGAIDDRFNHGKMNLVTLRDVSVAYDGYEALRHVDLEIADLDFLGVIGPNGGGKTTLVKAILGTVPHTGELTLAPELFRGKERLIGYMPQISDFDRAFPISVLEVVLSGLQGRRGFSSRYTKEDRARAMELLAASGIADTARSPIGEVSGGQMQRALLARAVISDPKLLILDEPANFVDNKFEKELYRTLHELNARMAIVMVSHDIGTITSVVKEIVCVNRQVHRHRSNILTEEQLRNYDCPIQLVSHGHIPHTVLEHHPGDCCRDHE